MMDERNVQLSATGRGREQRALVSPGPTQLPRPYRKPTHTGDPRRARRVASPRRDAAKAEGTRRVMAEISRAVVYARSGGPEVLTVVDRQVRDPGPGEVAIRVHRSGVNPTDWKSRQGGGPSAVSERRVPGQDGAGVVAAAGHGVDRSLLGRRVWVWEAAHERADGTAQEWAVVPVRQVVPLPDDASFDLGASLGIPFM